MKCGFIKELSNLPGTNPELKDASLTQDGILILNKLSPMYDILKKMLPRVMLYSDHQLIEQKIIIESAENPDGYKKLYLNVLDWEIKRREVKVGYLEDHSDSKQPLSIFSKFMERLKRKGR